MDFHFILLHCYGFSIAERELTEEPRAELTMQTELAFLLSSNVE